MVVVYHAIVLIVVAEVFLVLRKGERAAYDITMVATLVAASAACVFFLGFAVFQVLLFWWRLAGF